MSRSSEQNPDDCILIVTGSTLRAEEMDRPLAYYIRQFILDHHCRSTPPTVYVISDFRYLDASRLAELPTISVGGPGVNALAHKWLETLPAVLTVDCEFYIQLADDEGDPPRASIWGMDHESTRLAVASFLENYLDRFIDLSVQPAEKV
jgi:hypothetical protein